MAPPHPLCDFIDASPSPYHACATVATRLDHADFERRALTDSWADPPPRGYAVGGGTLVAWALPPAWEPREGVAVIGAHTDSPNLRIKPRPDTGAAGYRQLGVEIYGGALLNSWLDRDLGLSGRVAVRGGDEPENVLFRVDTPLLRVPQLAIHLDREINEAGLKLNKQRHLVPIWGLGTTHEGGFRSFVAKELGIPADDVLAWELMAHDLTPSTVLGADAALISAPRIDNLASCWAAVEALVSVEEAPATVLCLYDHEEVGSQSATGASGPMLANALERLAASRGADREDFLAGCAASWCVSADGAHATNPNYVERHEPDHQIAIGGGPVIKHNANERYATDSDGVARFALACDRAPVPYQSFVSRSDMPCGSTIGPITAARLGIRTIDVGIPQLAMHSARELCGTADPFHLVAALHAWLT